MDLYPSLVGMDSLEYFFDVDLDKDGLISLEETRTYFTENNIAQDRDIGSIVLLEERTTNCYHPVKFRQYR
jgi:hypothetical protein